MQQVYGCQIYCMGAKFCCSLKLNIEENIILDTYAGEPWQCYERDGKGKVLYVCVCARVCEIGHFNTKLTKHQFIDLIKI